ncbi:molybdopterin oxidoreductase family protein [Gloeomargarita lithophora]|uniref:molybdopterin oxidoreductase family protein n=1 Tax=Gloeomargarita lithophora TaxID=1188228 RepID=UPI003F704F2F
MVRTLCSYCGVGCGLEAVPQANGTYKMRGDRAHPSSLGLVCVKGATILESLGVNRLTQPQWRQKLTDEFQPISWEQALAMLAEKLAWVRQKYGSDAICFYGSGQLQTEDYYVAQKLAKGCLGTNNFDTNSRMCMSSAVAAYQASLGSDGPPCCYEDLELTDCAFLIGTNTAACHPIVFNRLRQHHKRNPQVKLIVVDPRCTATAEVADLHLAIAPGTDIDLLHGIGHLLWQSDSIDQAFIHHHTQGFTDYVQVIQHYIPERVAQRCGITIDQLQQAAQWWGESKRVLSLWSMGINQSAEGTAKARSLMDLHLLTGQIGRPGCGPFSLTGQPNAMGGRETGGLAHLLPGYRQIENPQHRGEIEHFWGLPPGSIASKSGRSMWEMITGLEQNQVHCLWIVATNPLVSMPDLTRVQAALRRSPFTVVQDAYAPTETTEYAHLLLPAAQWGEKTGTMTNSERRVTLCPQFLPPPGTARGDWEIFAEVGRRLGFTAQFNFTSAAEVFAEFVQLTQGRGCDYSGLSHERLAQLGPITWPCPLGTDDTEAVNVKRLYLDKKFATPDGKARFAAIASQGLAEPPDGDFPFVLTTGRYYGHWHTQTRTGRIAKIQKMHPEPRLEIHPQDAYKLAITTGDWVRVISRRGQVRVKATVGEQMRLGTVFLPMHWGALWGEQMAANNLTHPQSCPVSRQPELKACAVRIEPEPADGF